MKLIDLHWDNNKGEGHVKYTKAFEEAHIVLQLDMLQDCIVDLEDKYNSLLACIVDLEDKYNSLLAKPEKNNV